MGAKASDLLAAVLQGRAQKPGDKALIREVVRLETAAATMLAALREAAEAIAFYSGNDGVDHESVRQGTLQRINAAIAAATGIAE